MVANLFLILIGFIAVGGYLQVIYSDVYNCGKYYAGTQIKIFVISTIFQAFLYFYVGKNRKITLLYNLSQWIFGGLVFYSFLEFFFLYSSLMFFFFVLFTLCFAYLYFVLKENLVLKLAFLSFIYILLTISLATVFSTFFLYSKNFKLTNEALFTIIFISGSFSLYLITQLNQELPIPKKLTLLPFSFLLLAVLRAKLPDNAYDTLQYKGTLPFLFSDYRTAITTVYQEFILGMNLQEILNSILLIIDSNYSPSFISTLMYVFIFFIIPFLGYFILKIFHLHLDIVKILNLSLIFSTEALTSQGISYHEPTLLLFGVLSFVPNYIGILFFALAITTKLSMIYMSLIVFWFWIILYKKFQLKSKFFLSTTILLASLIVGISVFKGYSLTRRLLSPSSTLVWLTDPKYQVFGKEKNLVDEYITNPRGGVLNNFLLSTCNKWGMDIFCSPKNYLGYHVFPGSRLPLIGLVISLWLVFLFRKSKHYNLILVPLLFILQYYLFLKSIAQGRLFTPLTISAIILIALLLKNIYFQLNFRRMNLVLAVYLILVLSNDLIVGVSMNDGFICTRDLRFQKIYDDTYTPKSKLDIFLKNQFASNKEICRNSNFPPSVLGHVGPKPYMGFHYVFFIFALDLNERFLKANPHVDATQSIAGFIFEDPNFPKRFLNDEQIQNSYELCYEENNIKVLCNKKLRENFCFQPIYKQYLLY